MNYRDFFSKTLVSHDTPQNAETESIDPSLNYRELFNKMINGFAYHKIITDEKGKPTDYVYIEVNKAFEELTGLTRDTVLGKKVTEVLPGIEHDQADWIERYAKVALTGVEDHFESYSESLKKWFKVYAFSPHREYFAVLVEDITNIKEEAESNLYYKLLLDRTGDLIDILSTEFHPKYLYSNKVHKEILGYDPKDLLGKKAFDLVHPDDRHILVTALLRNFKRVGERLLQKRTNLKPELLTYRFKKKSGEYLTIQSTADFIDGKIFVVSRDVTSQSNYLEKLKEEKEKTENYLNIVANIVLVLDVHGNITTINKSGCDILGDTLENIIGKNWLQEYIPESDQAMLIDLRKKIFEKDSSFDFFENEILTKKGERRLIRWHNKLLTDSTTGEFIGTLSSGEDITEIRAREIETRKNYESLEKFNKLSTGRELKMIELKKRVKELEEELANKT